MSEIDRFHADLEMDRLLSVAMQARAETAFGGDLAAAAMERARMRELRATRLRRIGHWVRFSSVAAAVLLVSVIVLGFWWERQLNAGAVVTQAVTQSSMSGSNGFSEAEVAGVMLLLIVCGGILIRGVLSSERGPAEMGRLLQVG